MLSQGPRPVARAGAALALLGLLLGPLVSCGDGSDDAGESSPSSSSTSSTSSSPASGSGGSTLDAATLDGMTYASTSVEGRELVAGTTVELRFEGDTLSVWAGCNTVFAPFDVDGDTLAWSVAPAATMMSCDTGLGEQDQWLADLLESGVTATADGNALTLTGDDITLELETQAPEDLTGLLGRTWTVIGTVSDGTVARLPVATRRPRLDVGADGLARLFTGCRSGRVTVQVQDTALVFSNATLQRGRCSGPARQTERTVLALLDGPSDNAELHEHLLVVTKGGEGLFFEIR